MPWARAGLIGRARALLRNRRTGPPDGLTDLERQERRRVRDGLADVEAAIDAGRLADARRLVDDLARDLPRNTRVQERRAAVLELAGEVTEPLRILARLNERRPDPDRLIRERRLAALLVETSPGWLPRVPGPPRPTAARPGVVAHLVGVGSASIVDAASFAAVGVTVHSISLPDLDLGAWYPADRALPDRLEDEAWLAARIARAANPAVLHATEDRRGPAIGLVALALRAHLGCPVVFEPASAGVAAADSGYTSAAVAGELAQRREAVAGWLLARVDAVLVRSEASRERMVLAGVDPDRVITIAPGSGSAAERLALLYRTLGSRPQAADGGAR